MKLIKCIRVQKVCSQFQMQKSLLSLQSKSKPQYFCPATTLQTQYSTIQPLSSDIENVELVSEDELKMSFCKEGKKLPKHDSVHLEIELDDGKVEMIFPQINDNPFELAKQFCQQFQLDEQMLSILTQNIRNTINRLKNNKNTQKQKRFTTEPVQVYPRQQKPKKFDTSIKNNVSNSRDFAKKKQSHRGSIKQQIQSQNVGDKQKSKKSTIQQTEYTHSPKINPLSQKICNAKQAYKSTKRQRPNTFDSVRTQSSIKTEPFDDKEFRREHLNKENELHSVFDYLYEDSRLKELKKKEKMEVFMKRNCNFKPQINTTSTKIVGNRSFEQRLKTSIQRSSEKDLKNKKVLSSSVQKSKGSLPKHYFKLQTFNQSQKPAITYSLKNLTKNTHPTLSKPYITSSTKNIFSKAGHPSQQTQILYENQKQKAFRSIFCLLDDDEDGIISILNINLINGIEQKMIQILFPVLEELEILETQLNEKEFCSAIDKLFNSLSVDEKDYLLKYCNRLQKKQKQRQQNEPIKPTMSPLSSQLVTNTQRNNVSVYEYSKICQELKQQKLQQQRIMKERSVMRNCTFHPKTNPKKPIYF